MLGPSRIVGLGGAYTGVAEGVDGVTSNVAAPAVRAPYSSHHVDIDLTASVSLPGAFSSTDFENRGALPSSQGSSSASGFVYGNAGLLLQVGPFGGAFTIDATSYTLTAPSGQALAVRVLRAHAIVAWAFWRHQLVIGAGACGASMNLPSNALSLAPPSGLAPEVGMLLKIDDEPWRFGLSGRAPVIAGVGGQVTTDVNGFKTVAGCTAAVGTPGSLCPFLPTSVVLPGQIDIGFALQLGPRPLNPHWIDPTSELEPLRQTIEDQRTERAKRDAQELAAAPDGLVRSKLRRELDSVEKAIRRVEEARVSAEEQRVQDAHDARYKNWPRPKLLIVVNTVITAPVGNAVAVSSFLDQTNKPAYGGSWTISPRVGLEGEPVPDRFKLRFGSYLEPSLFDGGSARQHFTFGGDLKLFHLWDFLGSFLSKTTWQLSFATDLAPRYTNWGISLGAWQ